MPGSDHLSDADENSPLVMSPVKPSVEFERQAALAETNADADALAQARRNELAEQESKSTWYLVLLTLSIGG
jgi:solute carrier family 45 protein 1/2/4